MVTDSPVKAGGADGYSVNATNTGQHPAGNVVLTDSSHALLDHGADAR